MVYPICGGSVYSDLWLWRIDPIWQVSDDILKVSSFHALKPLPHRPCDHVTTYVGLQIKQIASKSLTNRAIELRNRGWWYEQIWSQQGRWSCSKLWTCDYKSQELVNRSYMIVRPVAHGRTIDRAWSWQTSRATGLATSLATIPFVKKFHDW